MIPERKGRGRPGLRQLARTAKRLPGYGVLIEEVLPRIRRSSTLSDLAHRVFATEGGAGSVAVALYAGHGLQGADISFLPVVGIVVTGLTDDETEGLIDQIADLQRESTSFRPLVIADRAVFHCAHRHGYVLEVVLPRDSFETPAAWRDYLALRLAGIRDDYQLWHLALNPGAHLEPLTEALLRQLAHRLPERLDIAGPPPEDAGEAP